MTQASMSLAQTVIYRLKTGTACRFGEEVRIRLEMAMITSRTLKLNSGRRAGKIPPLASGRSQFEAVELVCTSQRCGGYGYARARASNSKGRFRPASPKRNQMRNSNEQADHHSYRSY
jgi:hypothetical protein